MVRIDAAQIVNVKRNAGIAGKRQEEFSRQLSIKLADHRGSKIDIPDQIWAAGNIQNRARERFIKRHVGRAETRDSGFVS